jgi:succinyl-CoA synthetase beta subunit
MGRLQEYISKDLLSRSGLTIPKGIIVSNDSFNLDSVTFPLVVKAQIPIGGRGKSGGIKIANSRSEATDIINSMIGSSINGVPVDTVLLEEKVDIKQELYVSVFIDRDKSNALLMISEYGGIDIEELDSEKILKININPLTGIKDYMLRSVIGRMSLDSDVIDSVKNVIRTIYDIFIQYDAELVEINPLVITTNSNVVALDAKIIIDDNSLFRQNELEGLESGLNSFETNTSKLGVNGVFVDGDIAIITSGAGLQMATNDTVTSLGGLLGPTIDMGGTVLKDEETLNKAIFGIISELSILNPKVILFNTFFQFARCDVMARAIKNSLSNSNNIPIVARLQGRGDDEAAQILSDSPSVFVTKSFEEACTLAVNTAKGGN